MRNRHFHTYNTIVLLAYKALLRRRHDDIIEAVERGKDIPPLDLEQDIMEGLMLQFLLIFLVVCLSLFITVRFITRRLWLPFDKTLQEAERFNIAQDTVPDFTPTDISEFVRLNHTLERLMRKDHETFHIQKEFTENASHELQTPLAILRGKLDLLMQENLTEKQMLLVSDIYGLIRRMSHLNRNLLLLAKIDNAQYSVSQKIDIAELISESLPSYYMLHKKCRIIVTDNRTMPESRLEANPVLLESLLRNLIVNAIRNSLPESEVNITITDNSLAICNDSSDGTPLNRDLLFRRFFRDNRTRNGNSNSNGLGLAIVKAICDIHGWTVDYRLISTRHCFTVNFRQ